MKSKHIISKISILLLILLVINAFNIFTLGINHSESSDDAELSLIEDNTNIDDNSSTDNFEELNLNNASEKVLSNVTRKERRISELTDKYNDSVYGNVAYYLEVAQKYSLPICFIGITIGAFNFLIIGNKMLDKKEQGFGWIVGFTIGLVVFNILPLLFALFVAGR